MLAFAMVLTLFADMEKTNADVDYSFHHNEVVSDGEIFVYDEKDNNIQSLPPRTDKNSAWLPTAEAYTVVNYANARVGSSYSNGYCQSFVWSVLLNSLGVGNISGVGCCAKNAWDNYGISTSSDDIPLGAAVYWNGGSTYCGSYHASALAGHVGIYVGDGYVVNAYNGKVYKDSITKINNWKGYSYLGWGWQGGHALATTTPPTVTSITPSKSFAYVGENVTFTIGAENWTLNYYSIVLNGVGIVAQSDIDSNVFSYTFTQAGTYTIEADSWNSAGTTHLPAIQYTVVGTPTVTSITPSKSFAYVGENVTFTLGAENWTLNYYSIVLNGVGALAQSEINSNVFSYTFTQAGSYTIEADSWNPAGTTHLPAIQYTVVGTPIIDSITASQSSTYVGDTVTFTMNATNAEMYAFAIGDGTNVLQDLVFQQENTFVWTFSYAGTYFIWGAVHNGFETTYTKPEQVYTIVVSPIAEKSSVTNVEVNGSSVMVHFTPAAGAESYNIYLQKEGQSTPEYQALDVVNTISYTFTGVSDGTYNAYIISKPYKDFNEQKSSYYLFAVNTQVTTYTVTYDANGGTGAPAMQTKMQGEALTLSTAKPTREGYTFLGWAENADAAAVQYQPGDSFTKDADTTLYAVWVLATSATIHIDSVSCRAGETVDVQVSLKNNPGIASLRLNIAFEDMLSLESVEFNPEMGGQFQQPQTMKSPVTVAWFNGTADFTDENAVFVTLRFKVSEDAKEGDATEITVTYDPKDIYNIKEEDVLLAVENGSVTIINCVPGDINADGTTNMRDLTRLFQYLANWDVDVNTPALDVNGDGSINMRDLTRLFQYLANWDVEIFPK